MTWDNGYEGNYWSNYTGDGITPYEVFAEYHYFDGSLREDTNISLGQDLHPLLTPFDIRSINIQLPSWANITVSSPHPTPSFPPKNVLASSQSSPSPSPTSLSTSPTPIVPEFPSWIILLLSQWC